jgi:hypothetical protein
MERPAPITNEGEWQRDCKEVVDVSRSILDGKLALTEGARLLAELRSRVRAEEDKDFLVFMGIDSQTDHFPLGEVRARWDPAALARYDAERHSAESDFRQSAEEACRNLVRKYANAA